MITRNWCLIGTLSAACLLSGCVGNTASWRTVVNPFRRSTTGENASYARIKELRDLARRGGDMSPPDQDQLAADLTSQLGQESDSLIRLELTKTLGVLRAATATLGLANAARDEDDDVRMAACQALALHDHPQAIATLEEVLRDDTNIDVRLAAARALGAFKNPAAARALSLAVHDPDPALQYRGVQSLRAISGEDFGNSLVAWRQYAQTAGSATDEYPTMVAGRDAPRY